MKKLRKMSSDARIIEILFGFLLLVAGCAEADDVDARPDPSDATVSKDPICAEQDYVLSLDSAHNYEFESEVDIKVFELREYPNIPSIDWSAVTTDILGRSINPAEDIGHIEIILWNVDDYETFEHWLNIDELEMDRVETMVNLESEIIANSNMIATLDQFGSFGTKVDAETFFHSTHPFPSDDYKFVLVFGRGTTIGYDAVSAAFLKPVASPNAPKDLKLDNDAISLRYTAKLNRETYSIPQDGNTTFDWLEMIGQPNALGQALTPNQVGKIMLTFYKDKNIDELEESFIDLEAIADRKYAYSLSTPEPVSIFSMTDENGNVFDGFEEEEGTWLISLWCTNSCNNPAPKFLATLSPCR